MSRARPVKHLPASSFGAGYFSSGSYDTYEKDILSWVGPTARRIFYFLADIPRPSVLDAGCAQGYLLESLGELGAEVRGLEYSDYAIDGALPPVRDKIRKGSILNEKTFPANSFDAITCFDVLEYLTAGQNPVAAGNMVRWTRKFVFFTNPYKHSVSGSQKLNPDELRLTAFTQKEYVRIFDEAGADFAGKFNSGSGGDILVFEKKR